MQTVINRYMLPDVRRGQMAQGIMKGVRALLNELGTNQLTTSTLSPQLTRALPAGTLLWASLSYLSHSFDHHFCDPQVYFQFLFWQPAAASVSLLPLLLG